MAGDAENESKGFSLFSALNGLFERARMSAERESQRLFSSPQPRPRKPQTFSSARARRTTAQSPTRNERRAATMVPKYPAALARSRTATPRGRRAPSPALFERPASVVSERTQLASTVNLMAIQEAASESNASADTEFDVGAPYTSDPMQLKRKLSSSSDEEGSQTRRQSGSGTPKRPRSEAAHSPLMPPQRPRIHIQTEDELRAAMPPPPQRLHPATLPSRALASPSTPALGMRTRAAGEPARAPAHPSSNSSAVHPAWRTQMRSNSVSNNSSMPVPSSAFAALSAQQMHADRAPPVVERARLEKVERELHRLKKIIASLLPEELNDDDLRSVYGDLEQPRLTSEDIVARLMKTRLGPHINAYTGRALGIEMQNMPLPLSPISTSPAHPGSAHSRMHAHGSVTALPPVAPPPPPVSVPAAPPPPPPLASSSSLNLPVSPHIPAEPTFSSYRRSMASGTERPHSMAALHHRHGSDDSSSSVSVIERPRVLDSTVRRLREELRPVPTKPTQAPAPPPPPHKDPSVMSKLLAEMKNHKLRSVKKPKDMA
ncbi:hypothetical protein LPJ73_002243 [Coemansia sp. RSA 2703]|nr:hypothetical protein LPJ73_002243 [Coemansia sp. RSA 2703]KAJ2376584.1 hypothetical protein IW150_001897 [Coemansia sp. RSA 2607]KAJ2397280.1 hypothetical protein GGI05_000722 [Coemansia sp. RSA 2603]